MSRAEAYRLCHARTRAAGSSFGLGMRLFPAHRRDDVVAVYAFFRHTDDIVDGCFDDPAQALRQWREATARALAGGPFDEPWLEAVAATAWRCGIPARLYSECIDACESDLAPVRIATHDALWHYCDGVAGTVGEACLRILGYGDEAVLGYSMHNARAVQLVNILRDVSEDARRGRTYLPGLPEPAAVAADAGSPAVIAVLREWNGLAESEFRRAEPMFDLLRPADRVPMVGLTVRYRHKLRAWRLAGVYGNQGRRTSRLAPVFATFGARWWPTWRG